MRFIRQIEIVVTECNDVINDNAYIVKLLQHLKKTAVNFRLEVNKFLYSDYSRHKMTYDKARVRAVDEEGATVDFLVFQDTAMHIMENVVFSDIVEIGVFSREIGSLELKEKTNIWDFIDIDEQSKKDE